jgi:hypothetical protein
VRTGRLVVGGVDLVAIVGTLFEAKIGVNRAINAA